ncbi:MAG: CHASE2 domain-containing protein, partial [Betaproteobacteria bacterium]
MTGAAERPAPARPWRSFAGIAAASAGLAVLALILPWLAALDLFAYDAWHRLLGSRAAVTRTAIVAIDDASLQQFGDTPLPFWQPQLGAAIGTLRAAGVQAIGIDLIQVT